MCRASPLPPLVRHGCVTNAVAGGQAGGLGSEVVSHPRQSRERGERVLGAPCPMLQGTLGCRWMRRAQNLPSSYLHEPPWRAPSSPLRGDAACNKKVHAVNTTFHTQPGRRRLVHAKQDHAKFCKHRFTVQYVVSNIYVFDDMYHNLGTST